MTWLLGLLGSRIFCGSALAGVLVMTTLWGVQTVHAAHLQHALTAANGRLATAKASLDTCQDNRAKLQAAIEAQNQAVQALKADGDRRATMLAEGLQAARKTAAAATSRAEILERLRPSSPDVCQALLEVDRAVNGGH